MWYTHEFASSRVNSQMVSEHDFTVCKAILVGSVPGSHTGSALKQWGHMRVRSCLARFKLPRTFATQSKLIFQVGYRQGYHH